MEWYPRGEQFASLFFVAPSRQLSRSASVVPGRRPGADDGTTAGAHEFNPGL